MTGLKIYEEERPWGSFRQFTHNSPSTVKIITVNAGEQFSLQFHKKRAEFWRVIAGEGIIEVGDNKFNAKIGGEYEVPVETKHRIVGGPSGISVLEIATGDFDEKDIVRLEDKYGRA